MTISDHPTRRAARHTTHGHNHDSRARRYALRAVGPSPARVEAPEPDAWLPILDVTGEIARLDLTGELELLRLEEGALDLDRELEELERSVERDGPPRAAHEHVALLAPEIAPVPVELPEGREIREVPAPAAPAPWVPGPAPTAPAPAVPAPAAPAPEVAPARHPATRHEVAARRRAQRRRRRTALVTFYVAVLALVAAVVPVLLGGHTPQRNVVVSVDGRTIASTTRASTVGELLADHGVKVGRYDRVVPALGAHLSEGEHVRIVRAIPLRVDVDGVLRRVHTTERRAGRVARALHLDRGLRLVSDAGRRVRSGDTLVYRTPHDVTLQVDGSTVAVPDSVALDVGQLLNAHGVVLGGQDEVAPAPAVRLADGMTVTVTRVAGDTRAEDVVVPFGVEVRADPTLPAGTRKVIRAGVNGVNRITFRVELRNGAIVSKTPIATAVVKAPVSQVVARGTKKAAPAPAAPVAAPSGGPQQSGSASWYETGPGASTCAHLWLPFGTRVTIVNRATGARATCIVGDRGPQAWTGHIIDLSPTVFSQLAPLSRGVVSVDLYW